MSIVYFDSSAMVKLLVEEDGSDVAAALWDGCDAAVSSRLAYPEVRTTLAAAGHDRRLTTESQRQAEAAWVSGCGLGPRALASRGTASGWR